MIGQPRRPLIPRTPKKSTKTKAAQNEVRDSFKTDQSNETTLKTDTLQFMQIATTLTTKPADKYHIPVMTEAHSS